ncbi:3-hydroxybutyrate dehydrogenase type 2-like isoform X3 [Eriocheir sinensis]|uniref:3-hydroxybutyrate dehydrogenase type 2-like isoform X2 n=1 Tax=Eriocheir sinensis TaxID=95602 RepID=UPI0021CAB526|nr:3-hydroxybutyrate dehydrogenase type 2-like isoform X2 [Eriocheir sinensis]XP_050719423.1 3-hydroxybutyrate dehydrogenase type 2-like isoform X3 [Eriocheir sinensis]
MAGRLAGKRCVVTAAAQGIGRATAEAFLKEGAAMVVAVDVNAEKLKEFTSERVERRVLDVRDAEGVKALANDYPDIDVLFNCVGIVHQGTLLETTEQDWDNSFDVNVKSMFLLCKAFIPQMIRRSKGSIINVSSVASSLRGIEKRTLYGATKAAVIGLTKGVARDHVRQGVRCNVICPSPVATPSYATRSADPEDSDKEHIDYMENKMIGRLAKPEEVANLCVYLASDESSYHTGNVFVIDGGFTL